MARSEIHGTQISDDTLTGADLYDGLGFYDETNDYTVGSTVLWSGSTYRCDTAVSGTIGGDLSHAPDISPSWTKLDWEDDVIMYSVTAATSISFTNTRITIPFDTELLSCDFAYISSNNIYITKDIDVFISVSLNIGISNSSTSRTVSSSYLQLNTGGGFVDVTSFRITLYHRRADYGDTSSTCVVFLSLHAGDILRVRSVRAKGSAVLANRTSGCIFNIFTSKGLKGDKGDKGDPGDMRWVGDWVVGNYVEGDTVYYQGSSYVCIQNTTAEQPPTDQVYWDLVAQKGDDGSGSSIYIQEDGIDIPNTPHSTLNFTGEAEVYDTVSGTSSGTATINILRQLPIWYLASGIEQAAYSYEVHTLAGSTVTQEGASVYVFNEGSMLVI